MIAPTSDCGKKGFGPGTFGSAIPCPCFHFLAARCTSRHLARRPTIEPGNAPTTTTLQHFPARATATSRNRGRRRSRIWKMRVLVTADTVGGVWTYAPELVTGLVRRGVMVALVSFGGMPSVGQARWMRGL